MKKIDMIHTLCVLVTLVTTSVILTTGFIDSTLITLMVAVFAATAGVLIDAYKIIFREAE